VKVTATLRADLDVVVGSRRADPADLDYRTGRGGVGGDNFQFYGRYLNRPGMDYLAITQAVAQFVVSRLGGHLEAQRVSVPRIGKIYISAADMGDLDVVTRLVRAVPANLDHLPGCGTVRRDKRSRWNRRLEHHRMGTRLPAHDCKLC